jgi:AraC family transcriptional regulator
MKKKIILISTLLIGLLSIALFTAEPAIQVTEKPAFEYAYMSFSGSFKTMPEKIMLFIGEFFKQGLLPQGALLAVYYNSPDEVAENDLKWGIGFPVSSGTAPGNPLQLGTYEKKTVVEVLHKGSYDRLPEIYQKLGNYIMEKGFTIVLPTFEFYLNSPQQVKPEELLTRIEIPVKKK